jgi:hypothetical protein
MGFLATYTPEYDQVVVKGQAMRVRGLTGDDLGLLVRAHLGTVEAVLQAVKDSAAGPLSGDQTSRFVLMLAQDAPEVVAQIIAIASDEPDQADAARKLPFPVQIDALQRIGRLTFEEAGGSEGFANALAALVAGTRKKPASATTG